MTLQTLSRQLCFMILALVVLFLRHGPVAASTPIAVAQVAGGNGHSLALDTEGTLWAWGSNQFGQLGDGSTKSSTTPRKVGSGYVAISAGGWHSLAIKSDGSLWTWGLNSNGQLGDGTTGSSAIPRRIGDGYKSVSGGAWFSLALKVDGSVWAWGSNAQEQLGIGSAIDSSSPRKVADGFASVSAGVYHALGIKSNGELWAWGFNRWAMLGNGTTTARNTPVLIGVGFSQASAGYTNSFAIKTDGTLWAWGDNEFGQIGDGTTTTRLAPVQIGSGFVQVLTSAGVFNAHSFAQKTDGTLWAWGRNIFGQLGDSTNEERRRPIVVGKDHAAFAAGWYHSLLVADDGSVQSFGYNNYGQLGNGTLAARAVPGYAVQSGGVLDLIDKQTSKVRPDRLPPFVVEAEGAITDSSATAMVKTQFNAADIGKPGAVYVLAKAPAGTLGGGVAPPPSNGEATSAGTASSFVLMQLTPTGWQQVVNGQLIPYASGVLGDQLAAQNILNSVATANLKGAQFCVGYGTTAAEMTAAGRIVAVASVADPSGTVTGQTCAPVQLTAGWNLLGNGLMRDIPVTELFADAAVFDSVWAWDVDKATWRYYNPGMGVTELSAFIAGKGYSALSTLRAGEGYWVNAKRAVALLPQPAAQAALTKASLRSGWNLVSSGAITSPQSLNTTLAFNSLWAWDATQQSWYFYAPSLDAAGGQTLADYVASKRYLDFSVNGKSLGPDTGFWVEMKP